MTNSPAHVSRYRQPLHPPFTHFPLAAYVLAAGFDVISVIGGSGHAWASELWQAGTFGVIAGLALCLMTMLSGFAVGFQNTATTLDLGIYAAGSYWLRRPPGTARRLIRFWERLATG